MSVKFHSKRQLDHFCAHCFHLREAVPTICLQLSFKCWWMSSGRSALNAHCACSSVSELLWVPLHFLSCEYKKSPGAFSGPEVQLAKQNTETTEQKETLDLLFSLVSAAQGGKPFHRKPVVSETRERLSSPAPKRRKALIFFFFIKSSIHLCLCTTADISGI